LAGVGNIVVEADLEFVFAGARALSDAERHGADGGEIADRVFGGDRDVNAHLVGLHLLVLGVVDRDRHRQRDVAALTARPEKHTAGEAVFHGHAALLEITLARSLGDLAAMHDSQPVADTAGLVDRHVPVARRDDHAWAAVRDDLAARDAAGFRRFGGGEELLLADARRLAA